MRNYTDEKEVVDRFYGKYISTPENLQKLMNRIAEAPGVMEAVDLPAVVYVLETQARILRKHPEFVDLTGSLDRMYNVITTVMEGKR